MDLVRRLSARLHPQRCVRDPVYPDALHSHPATLTLCPYFDCGVSTRRHGWRWATIRREHPDYPARPERDVMYVR